MCKELYEIFISEANTMPELKMINRFLVCDFQIQGKTNDYLRQLIAHKESMILLQHVEKVPQVRV